MKTESIVKYVLRLAVTLLLITSVVAACLAGVNAITEPKIAALTAEKTQNAISAVLEGGGEPLASFTPDSNGWVSNLYKGEKGYAVEVTPTTGFDGDITMMVGVDVEGNVTGISIISHTETAGLGAVAAATTSDGEAFRGQFVGMGGTVSVSKDGGEVEAITGATITSRAICDGVNAALECVANNG